MPPPTALARRQSPFRAAGQQRNLTRAQIQACQVVEKARLAQRVARLIEYPRSWPPSGMSVASTEGTRGPADRAALSSHRATAAKTAKSSLWCAALGSGLGSESRRQARSEL
jgi:hypothetical protein